MNLNELIKEQQERNREETAKAIYDQFTYNGEGEKPNWVENGNSLKQDEARRMTNKLNIDQITQETAEAVRDWVVEIIKNQIQEINGEGSVFDDFAQDVITQLQANKDLSEKE